jgi:hypothetical protein
MPRERQLSKRRSRRGSSRAIPSLSSGGFREQRLTSRTPGHGRLCTTAVASKRRAGTPSPPQDHETQCGGRTRVCSSLRKTCRPSCRPSTLRSSGRSSSSRRSAASARKPLVRLEHWSFDACTLAESTRQRTFVIRQRTFFSWRDRAMDAVNNAR